eukprot:TRINITY_DN344_c1_g1_i1.p1 TRINITY_DN344_c1_g1~~TRINITY_DN344_c1_g1_i1.p1  ORF type:complete len:140 (-),score=42.44 TRINITY_DN344_c1_g1_i1:63-482(-)
MNSIYLLLQRLTLTNSCLNLRNQFRQLNFYERTIINTNNETLLCSFEFMDKIFSSAWLYDDTIIIGSKDNKLFTIKLNPICFQQIPLFDLNSNIDDNKCGIRDIAINPYSQQFAIANSTDVNVFTCLKDSYPKEKVSNI